MADAAGVGRKRVLVLGAGIAGMAAAHVLADAGLEVTVLEKESSVGGRCSSYFDEDLGHTVEHGIHGIFPRYANLKGLWADAEIDASVFVKTRTTGAAGPGRTMKVTELAKARGIAPLFLLRMVPSGVLRLRDYAFALPFLMRTYATGSMKKRDLDANTFSALLQDHGVSARMTRLLLMPYLRNLAYARGDEVSARVALEALAYYVAEDADAVKAEWIDGGMVPLVLDPWRKSLEARGVRFRLGVPARSFLFEEGRFVAVATKTAISEHELGSVAALSMRQVGDKYLAMSWEPAKRRLQAFDGTCTHRGCRIVVETTESGSVFNCPCHGGQFGAEGQVLRGPPPRPLDSVALQHDPRSGAWIVGGTGGADGDGLERADYVVIAMDIASLKELLPRELALNGSTEGIPLLRTTSVIVLRMRFSTLAGQPRWRGPDSGVFAGDDELDNFFVLHTMQKEFAALDDLFLECHIGSSDHLVALDDDDIYERALEVLDAYFPDEKLGARLDRKKSRVLRHIDGFSLFAPGDHERAPAVSHPSRPNVMFAGDWVQTDDREHRGFFMERAAITGIEAANAILRAESATDRQRAVVKCPPPFMSRLFAQPLLSFDAVTGLLGRLFGVADE